MNTKKLEAKVGKAGAEKAIKQKLNENGITIEEWRDYLKVKQRVQDGAIKIGQARKEVDRLVDEISCFA